MQSVKEILNNPLFKSTEFRTISIVVVSCIVAIGIFSFYQKIADIQKSEPVLVRKVENGRTNKRIPGSGENAVLPNVGHGMGYSISMWLWLDDFDYKYGEYKHILHKGDADANSVQPGIWLHPKTNKIMIRYDNDKRKIEYDFNKAKIFKSFTEGPSDHYDTLQGLNLENAKAKCSASSNCLGFAALVSDPNVDTSAVKWAVYPTTNIEGKLVSMDHKDDGYEMGTYIKNTKSRSMNPAIEKKVVNDKNISNDIDDVPLNRWFHLVIVVNNQTVEVYLDGKLRSTSNSAGHMKNNNGDLYIANDGGFGGYYTYIKYFDHPITQQEVSKIYYQGPSPFMLPDLYSYKDKIKDYMKDVQHEVGRKMCRGPPS